jgi:hypothetical protein
MNYEIPGKELALFNLAFTSDASIESASKIISKTVENKIEEINFNKKNWVVYVIVKELGE